jgi:hypothetical protein
LKRTIFDPALLCALLCGFSLPAQAQPRAAGKAQTTNVASDPEVVMARQLFVKGTALVQSAQWAEALGAFEESARLRPHPITTYNMGACERALGRYTVARVRLQRALEGEPGLAGKLPDSLRAEATAYLAEIERLLVHVDVKIAPQDATLAVDGRPLQATVDPEGVQVFVAGLRPAGRGEALPATHGVLVLDPGTHLFTLSRKGFNDQVITKTFKPGARQFLTLNLDRLPAKLRVSSNERQSAVHINRIDVGYAPAQVERPAGSYTVRVEKAGFAAYETTVKVNAGEAADIKARLSPTPITQKWWFWTVAGVLVSGAVVGTYYATRSEPAPQRPPPDGGALGWAVELP